MCNRSTFRPRILVYVMVLVVTTVGNVRAQSMPSSRTMAVRSRVQIAFGVPVQKALELNDDQKHDISEINRILKDEKTKLFQSARQNQIKTTELMDRLSRMTVEAESKLQALLSEQQRIRLDELFVQVNDVKSLGDARVAERLELSDEQETKLAEARDDNTKALRAAYPAFRNMTKDQQKEKFESLRKQNRTRLLAILSQQQRKQLDSMKGEPIEFAHSDFRIRRSRTNRTRNVSKERAGD
ncbi:hypothetical protein ACFL2H_03615 [Planctomycetota bacterium]